MRTAGAIDALVGRIERAAADFPALCVMEVCGTHTRAIFRLGIRGLLPKNVRLVSGPGCPVCVTDEADLARALWLARRAEVVLCCFGDMLRVPAGGESLLDLAQAGADVRVCLSPLDALALARENPGREVVWFGVGFETTAPGTAALVEAAGARGVPNLSVLSAHKTMPQAIRALLRGGGRVGALLCPGHVAAVAGAEAFRFVPEELGLPAAIAGFEAEEILLALAHLCEMRAARAPGLANAYRRAVRGEGNRVALSLLDDIFEPCPARWRGLGEIPNSGLALRDPYAAFDAKRRFGLPAFDAPEPRGCRCAGVLRGEIEPPGCPLFGKACTPERPVGACMVSLEGACAAYYEYAGEEL